MSTKNIPFEKFIKEFLQNSNYALELEKISKKSKNSGKFVSQFFESTEIDLIVDNFFDSEKIDDISKFKSILNRLNMLLSLVTESPEVGGRNKNTDILILKESMKIIIEDKKKVTKEFINYMNQMKIDYYE